MMHVEAFQFSNSRFTVDYHLRGSEREARAMANALCFDQTVELPDTLIEQGLIRDHVIGRVEHVQRLTKHACIATVSFSCDLIGKDFTQLLGVIFGIASFRPGIRVARLDLPDSFVRQWPGPRFGRSGLRDTLGVSQRPLVCGVLKPVGLSPSLLAERAYRMALGGLDFIKDDQGLVDQAFCPFDERISRCAEAVAQANRATGRTCLYIPHVTGSAKSIHTRALFAKQAGAGGVLLCPGLVGFEAVISVAEDETLELPIMTHPTFLGSLYMNPDHGMAPVVVFGQLPRLAGADVSIYPFYDDYYSMTREDCRQIAKETAVPFGHLCSILPTAAGRISGDLIEKVVNLYQKDVVMIVGGGLLQGGPDLTSTCRTLMKQVAHL